MKHRGALKVPGCIAKQQLNTTKKIRMRDANARRLPALRQPEALAKLVKTLRLPEFEAGEVQPLGKP